METVGLYCAGGKEDKSDLRGGLGMDSPGSGKGKECMCSLQCGRWTEKRW